MGGRTSWKAFPVGDWERGRLEGINRERYEL